VKITGCKFFFVETPRENDVMSEHLLIRVDTNEGVSGWGELSEATVAKYQA
jgi:L-alanine-DL-glutamate epimerase-like enolase superfamily enzyme